MKNKRDFIPVNEPAISVEGKNNVKEALRTGWISSSGEYIKEFEEKFAKYIGVGYAMSTNSGTASLHLATATLGIKDGDEVIVPAFTMGATWLSIIYTGAKPVFVDCERDTYNINPSLIEEKITKKTKAIMVVHIYGHPAEMDAILQIAKKHKLFVIEDAAEAHGAEYKGRKCGSFGDFGCFSFYANKIITTGEGGMAVTNNKAFAQRARKLKSYYFSDEKRFIHEKIGFNYQMTNMQAGLGLGQLKHIRNYIKKKRHMASLYKKYLSDIPGLDLPKTKSACKNVFWMYAVCIREKEFGLKRGQLRDELSLQGVETRDFFYPPTDQPFLKNYLKADDFFPNAHFISRNGLYLPSSLTITDKQILRIANTISNIYNRVGSNRRRK